MNTHVAVYSTDHALFDELQNSSNNGNFIMHHNPDLKEYSKDHFVICEMSYFLSHLKKFQDLKPQLLYILSNLSDEENMKIIEEHKIQHLVGLNPQIFAKEILNHLKKSFDHKIWGLDSYMGEDAEIRVLSLSESKNTNEMIEEALTHFDFKDYFSSPVEYIQVMANELISNSLYKGPNRKRSEQGLDSVDRKSPVFLKGSDLVQVSLGMDSSGVALSVQDSFGGLNYETLINSLKRSFAEKTVMEKKDGAGLGLYLTFLHSNQFIINYRENFRTEVICIIEKNKRYKNYKQRIRSFHFFQEVPSEKTNNK